MASEGRGADNIGTLSVDIVADLQKFDNALGQVEQRLGKANKDVHVRIGITDAQLGRLRQAAELIERIQKTGVTDLGVGAVAPAKGRGTAASATKATVNVSLKEADLTKLFRTAAEAAFRTPISGVKLDLDLEHIRNQLSGLNVSFGGATIQQITHAGGAPLAAAPRGVPAGIRDEIRSPHVIGAIDDMFTAINSHLKRTNQALLQGGDPAAKFTAIADAFGDQLQKVVSLGQAEGPFGRPVSGGAVARMLENAADDVADKLEAAGQTFYERVGATGLFAAYRAAGGQPAMPTHGGATQAPPVSGASQERATQLAQLRAADATTAAARRQASAGVAEGARSGVPKSIDDINSLVRQLATISGYNWSTAQGVKTRPWEDMQREFVAGRRAWGSQGYGAFGRVATSGGLDITDILVAAGPGARALSGLGEVMTQGKGTGTYVSLSPEEQEMLKGMPRRRGAAAGHGMVEMVAPREMLQRILMASRGVGHEEARQISQWAMRSGGPLASRDLGTLGNRSLGALMSGGGGTIEAEARDSLRIQRLEDERRGFMEQLAGTGVPEEQRRLRARIANRSGQLNRLRVRHAADVVTSEQNRQMIEDEAIDPLSRNRTRMEDRSSVVTALTALSQYGQEADQFNRGIEGIRNALMGGYLQGGEAAVGGGLTGVVGTGNQLFSSVQDLANEFRAAVGLPPTRRTGLKSITGQLEREGFPVQAAGIQMLFGERANRQAMAEAAISSYPQRTGMVEGRDIGVRPASARYERLRQAYEREARKFEETFGRTGSAAHDPLAAGMPPGSWEQRGIMGEGRLLGKHPQRLQPVTGEIDKIKLRVRERIARHMGVRFGEEGKVVLPDSGRVTEQQFEAAVDAALATEPRVWELTGGRPIKEAEKTGAERLARMRRALGRHEPGAYYRTGAPDVLSGDRMRRMFFDQSGMAPGGGVPVTPEEIFRRNRRGEAISGVRLTQGGPAWTVPGAASALGPSITPEHARIRDAGGAGGDGGGGPEASPMFAGRQVHVWIDGPFPLRAAIEGNVSFAATGKKGAIEQAMASGDVAGAQALNKAVENARGGWANPPKGQRINLDELRQAAAAGAGAATAAPRGRTQAGPRWVGEDPSIIYAGPSGPGAFGRIDPRRVAREARRPTRRELLTELAAAGYTEGELEDFTAPLPRTLRSGDVSERVFRARQQAREAQARLPSRALSTSIVQLSQRLFGGRQEPEENIIRLQRLTGQLGLLEGRGETLRGQRLGSYVDMRRAREAARGFEARGEAVPTALRNELEAATQVYNRNTEAWRKNEGQITKTAERVAKLGSSAVGAGDVLRNLGAGFVGGIGGGLVTMGVSGAIGVLGATASVIQEALKPAYEAAIGYQNVTNRVIGSLSDQVRANRGLEEETVALRAAQAGLAFSTYQSVRPQLEQASVIEAGNKAYSDYIDLIRAARRVGQEGAPRGLYQTTGGFNFLGVQTPFFGTPSTTENFLNQFAGAGYAQNDAMFPVGRSGSPLDSFIGNLQAVGRLPELFGAVIGGDQGALKRIIEDQTGSGIKTGAVDNINAQFEKIGSGFRVVADRQGEENRALLEAMAMRGVDPGKLAQIQGLGLGFEVEMADGSRRLVTSINEVDQALMDWTRSLTQMDPKTWLASITGPSGAFTANIWGLREQANLGRAGALAQFGLGRLAAPPVRLDQILSGMTGVPSQFTQAGPGGPPSAFMSTAQAIGQAQLQSIIGAIGDPAAQQQAQQMIGLVTQAGSAIHDLQVESQRVQMAAAFRGMARDIDIAKRSVSDLVGLTGQTQATMQDGTAIGASDIGILERRNMLLSRSLQLAQFEHQQRSLNYQIALAGFMAEGATGEERAARLEVAQREAQFQQDMLTGQRELADNNWQVQQLQNTRAFEDAMYQANELVRRLDDTAALARIDDKIQQWAGVRDLALELTNTYMQQGQGMIQLAIGVGQELIQLGTASAEAINLATGAMVSAIAQLNASRSTLPTTTTPVDDRPWWQRAMDAALPGGPGVTPMGGGGGGTLQININNPGAGVDTQSLTRVVITELNRQAALRGAVSIN
jgi:hypothetical protein